MFDCPWTLGMHYAAYTYLSKLNLPLECSYKQIETVIQGVATRTSLIRSPSRSPSSTLNQPDPLPSNILNST